MKTATESSAQRMRSGDVILTLLLLAIFVLAYVLAQEWPFRARLAPQLLTATGAILAVLKLIGYGIQVYRGPSGSERDGAGESAPQGGDIRQVLGETGRRAWAAALGWVAGFFVLLWVFGIFVTAPLFALVYLRFAGKTGWLGAGVYAAAAGVVLWFVFRGLLFVPMPTGIF